MEQPITKGGSWGNVAPVYFRAAIRGRYYPVGAYQGRGFRLASMVQAPRAHVFIGGCWLNRGSIWFRSDRQLEEKPETRDSLAGFRLQRGG